MNTVTPSSNGSEFNGSTTGSPAVSVGNRPVPVLTVSTLTSATEPEAQGCLEQMWTCIASLVSSLWNAVRGLFCGASVPAAPATAPTVPVELPRQINSIERRAELYLSGIVRDCVNHGFVSLPYKAAILIKLNDRILTVQGQKFTAMPDCPRSALLIELCLNQLTRIAPDIQPDSTLMISVIILKDREEGRKEILETSKVFRESGDQTLCNSEITSWRDPSLIPQRVLASYTGTGTTNQTEYAGLVEFFMDNDTVSVNIQNH